MVVDPGLESVIRTVRDQLRHGGGWSIDASVRVADWDRQALEWLMRYCARPPLASGRLGRLNPDTLIYCLRRPLMDGRTEILLRLVDLLTPPRKHRHRYCGVLAPARGPPQGEFGFDQIAGRDEWVALNKTAGLADEV